MSYIYNAPANAARINSISQFDPQTITRITREDGKVTEMRIDHFASAAENFKQIGQNLRQMFTNDATRRAYDENGVIDAFVGHSGKELNIYERTQLIFGPVAIVKNLLEVAIHSVAGIGDYILNGSLSQRVEDENREVYNTAIVDNSHDLFGGKGYLQEDFASAFVNDLD